MRTQAVRVHCDVCKAHIDLPVPATADSHGWKTWNRQVLQPAGWKLMSRRHVCPAGHSITEILGQGPLCPNCLTERRPRRSDGRYRGWCRSCESAQKGVYMASKPGVEAMRRFYRRRAGWGEGDIDTPPLEYPQACPACRRQSRGKQPAGGNLYCRSCMDPVVRAERRRTRDLTLWVPVRPR